MKVKIAELKNNLSKYVQSVREGGEPVEVCVRETTVAYLVGAEQPKENGQGLNPQLAERLRAKGLRWIHQARLQAKRLLLENPAMASPATTRLWPCGQGETGDADLL